MKIFDNNYLQLRWVKSLAIFCLREHNLAALNGFEHDEHTGT